MCWCNSRENMENRGRWNRWGVRGGVGRVMLGVVEVGVEWKIGINSNWKIIMQICMELGIICKYKI